MVCLKKDQISHAGTCEDQPLPAMGAFRKWLTIGHGCRRKLQTVSGQISRRKSVWPMTPVTPILSSSFLRLRADSRGTQRMLLGTAPRAAIS
jgi:hypothetical protein